MKIIKRIANAHKKMDAAKRELEAARIEAFPVGSYQRWLHCNRECDGTVQRHGGVAADRIQVLNRLTGKEYWIGTYNMAGEELGPGYDLAVTKGKDGER